jgi:hypothetical protein
MTGRIGQIFTLFPKLTLTARMEEILGKPANCLRSVRGADIGDAMTVFA